MQLYFIKILSFCLLYNDHYKNEVLYYLLLFSAKMKYSGYLYNKRSAIIVVITNNLPKKNHRQESNIYL